MCTMESAVGFKSLITYLHVGKLKAKNEELGWRITYAIQQGVLLQSIVSLVYKGFEESVLVSPFPLQRSLLNF